MGRTTNGLALAALGARCAVFILGVACVPSTRAQDCTRTSVGLTPLTELAGTHLGEPGGLYPGAANMPPAAHFDACLRVGRSEVAPLDAAGLPASDGSVVLVSIGMSNTTQEFSVFVRDEAGDPDLHPALRIVDLAQGGQEAGSWSDPASGVWAECDRRLAAASLTPLQVQAAWIKLARRQPATHGAFPAHAIEMQDRLREIMPLLRGHFPNLAIAYVSSRIYAGYATTALNPEPYAYEEAFSFRWIIEEQVGGAAGLNADPARGPVASPWLLWGPYLWADGLTPRADGLTWECSDFAADGTHPGPTGRAKVSAMLRDFFRVEPTARPWYLQPVVLRASRSGGDVVLAWTGAVPSWRVERADVARGPWTILDAASSAASHSDPDVGSGAALRFYAVW